MSIWVDTKNAFVLLLWCLSNYKLYIDLEETTVFKRHSNIILSTLSQPRWGVLQGSVLKTSKILSNFLRYSNKIEATGVENTPVRKNIWCKTLWMDVWNNWVTIPKDGQSKKIQCIQDSKHIEKDITRSAVFSSWLRITSFYWRVILSGPDIQTLKSELKKLYRESWIL